MTINSFKNNNNHHNFKINLNLLSIKISKIKIIINKIFKKMKLNL
jgi:hypothetical protein